MVKAWSVVEAGRRVGSDRGAGTVWVVALMTLIWFTAGALMLVGVARTARHHAQSAADLSALAAARQAMASPETACRHARDLASANDASITKCRVEGAVVVVRVEVPLRLPWIGDRHASAEARAGPR
ncbi:Rv3654c family TadE-like protein [Sphaerisporangium sp. NPDC004334]